MNILRRLQGLGFAFRRCPGCGRDVLVTMFHLARECKCGHYWADLGAGFAWYRNRKSFEDGEAAVELVRYE
jgi:recombinational DNA repair protein (RecF pathway)